MDNDFTATPAPSGNVLALRVKRRSYAPNLRCVNWRAGFGIGSNTVLPRNPRLMNYDAPSSNNVNIEPSGNMKVSADENNRLLSGAKDGRVLPSPYLNPTALRGENATAGAPIPSPSCTMNSPTSGAGFTSPDTVATTPVVDLKAIRTFTDSVISLCKRSLASSAEMSDAFPDEDMFLLLVGLCGVREAQYWSEVMGFRHQRSYALLSALLNGKQFGNRPNVVS
jgi:hypothetical protein